MPKLTAPAVALVLAAGLSSVSLAMENSKDMPAVMAVAFHADWCPGCKALGPKVMKAKKAHADDGVLFVKLDLTNDATKAQSTYLANALGLSKVYAEHGRKTAQVLLIDTKTKKVIGKLNPSHSDSDIQAALKKALKDSKA